jgi:hypothetical protein
MLTFGRYVCWRIESGWTIEDAHGEAKPRGASAFEDEALDEIERLQTDAARYRWLRANHIRSDPDMSGNHRWMSLGRSIGRGMTAEAAIDSAMRKEE